MPKGHWSAIATIGLAVLLSSVAAGWLYYDASRLQALYEHEAEMQAHAYRDTSDVRMRNRCAHLARDEQLTCVAEEMDARRRGEHDEFDLQAQLVTSAWTRVMGIAAIIGMAVGTLGVGLVFVTFRETRAAAEAARKTHQAYVDVERAVLIPTLGNGRDAPADIMARFVLSVSNIGRSAATIQVVRFASFSDPETLPTFGRYARIDFLMKDGASQEFPKAIELRHELQKIGPFIGGYIEYRSAFGITHRAYFCSHVMPDEPTSRPRLYSSTPYKRGKGWPEDT